MQSSLKLLKLYFILAVLKLLVKLKIDSFHYRMCECIYFSLFVMTCSFCIGNFVSVKLACMKNSRPQAFISFCIKCSVNSVLINKLLQHRFTIDGLRNIEFAF